MWADVRPSGPSAAGGRGPRRRTRESPRRPAAGGPQRVIERRTRRRGSFRPGRGDCSATRGSPCVCASSADRCFQSDARDQSLRVLGREADQAGHRRVEAAPDPRSASNSTPGQRVGQVHVESPDRCERGADPRGSRRRENRFRDGGGDSHVERRFDDLHARLRLAAAEPEANLEGASAGAYFDQPPRVQDAAGRRRFRVDRRRFRRRAAGEDEHCQAGPDHDSDCSNHEAEVYSERRNLERARQDSNLRPLAPEASALSTELRARAA